MPSMDDLILTQRMVWEVAEGAGPEMAARVICDVLGRCDAFASLIDPETGNGMTEGFAYLDPDLMEVMARDFGTPETNPIMGNVSRMQTGKFMHCSEFLDFSRIRMTQFHADWWIPSGVRDHAGGYLLQSPDGRVVYVTLGCLGDRDWFDASELRYASAACESMARALRASAAFAHEAACAGVAGREPDPCWLLGRNQEIRILNGPAREMTEDGAGPLLRDRRTLTSRDRRLAVRFKESVAAVCDGLFGDRSLLIVEERGVAHLTIEAGPRYRDERSALVTLRRPRPMAWSAEGLRDAYDLTPREADVAMAIAAGARPAEIAQALGLTVGSVRIYLKRIFAKTGTDGQGPLVSLLMGGPLSG